MENQSHNLSRQPVFQPHDPLSPDYVAWIVEELGIIAILLGAEVSEERLLLTANAVKQYPPRKLAHAFSQCQIKCRFFPVPADIIDHIEFGFPTASEVETTDREAHRRMMKALNGN